MITFALYDLWRPALAGPDRRPPRELRRGAELFFDAQQLVVLADAIGPAGGPGLDLPSRGADREIGDRRVLGLARAVGDDRAVARVARDADGVERLGDSSDLIQLHEQRIGHAVGDAALQDLRIGD